MRIEQLEYLTAVTRHGSLRRASEHLHLSQPALSESVRNLERELGVNLLDRRRSGARISRDGRDLLQPMQEVLDAVERLRAAADKQHHAGQLVRLATVNVGTVPLLAPALAAFTEERRGAHVEVITTRQADIHEALIEGSLDLGLITRMADDDVPVGLRSVTLVAGRPVVVLRGDHPLAAQSEITLAALRTLPFIAMRNGYLMHRLANRLFDGSHPHLVCSTDGAELAKTLISEGLGVSLLPDFSVDGDPLARSAMILTRPLAEPLPAVHLALLHRKSAPFPSAARELTETMLRVAQGASDATA